MRLFAATAGNAFVYFGILYLGWISMATGADSRSERALKEGLRLEAANQFVPAEQAFTEAIGQDASEAAAYVHRARVRFLTGRSEDALEDANAAVRLLSRSAEPFELRAQILARLDRLEDAVKDY